MPRPQPAVALLPGDRLGGHRVGRSTTGSSDPLAGSWATHAPWESTSETDLLWVRLLDVPAALAGRTYLCPGRVVLEVEDAMGLSGGRFVLEGGPDGAKCAPTDDPAELALSVSTLSSAYLGGYTLADLGRSGRVEERRPAPCPRGRHVPLPVSPWCVTHF